MTTERIIAQALSLGATSAGVVLFRTLRGVASADRLDSAWPDGAAALVVLTLSHPAREPDLDLWGVPAGTEGNRRMGETLRQLARWLDEELALRARPLAYHVEHGRALLKDAATLAGLGVIGANNLLITPEHGPRVRLRALALEREVEPTAEGAGGSPCEGCPRPCQRACPQQAFAGGTYQRARCQRQLALDEARPRPGADPALGPLIHYCRACELACPEGPLDQAPARQK